MTYCPLRIFNKLPLATGLHCFKTDMIAFCPRHDLSAFVNGLESELTLQDAVAQFHREIAETESSPSRDARIRFDQMRYVKSLNRMIDFLMTSLAPLDLTPRERLAIRGLSGKLATPGSLARVFSEVTLPAGTFGVMFDARHRLAS